jgi:uncharacterized membrane protein
METATVTNIPDRVHVEPAASLVTLTHVLYTLHAVGLAIGALGTASVVGSFLFGWPSIIAVIINYVKRGEAQGTWLESHFRWQISTFWWAMLWATVIWIVSLPAMLVLIGFGMLVVGFFVLGLWTVYRVAVGWLRLRDQLPIR